MELLKSNLSNLDELTSLYVDVVKDLENNINYPKWNSDYPSYNSIMEAINKNEQFMVLDNNEIIAAVILNENPMGDYSAGDFTKLNDGEFLVIHTLAVKKEYQGKSLGVKVIDLIKEYAKANNYKAIRLDVVLKNYPAIKLYEKCGFKFCGTKDIKRFSYIPLFDLYEYVF